MANNHFEYTAGARPVQHVRRFTPSSVSVGQTFRIVAGPWYVEYTAAVGSVADVVDGLFAKLTGDTAIPNTFVQNNLVGWTKGGGSAYLDAETVDSGDWAPFTTGGTGTMAVADAVAPSGPGVFSATDNWINTDTGACALPDDDDYVYFLRIPEAIFGDLEALAAKTFAELRIEGLSGSIGLRYYNADKGFYEWRPRLLKCGADEAYIGLSNGLQASYTFVKWDAGSDDTTVVIQGLGSSAAEVGSAAVEFIGTGTNNDITVKRGSVDIALLPGQVATVKDLRVGATNLRSTDSLVNVGAGVNLTNLHAYAGTAILHTDPTNFYPYGGEVYAGDGCTLLGNLTPVVASVQRV